MPFLYSLAVRAYGIGVRVASLFSSKARKWVQGRKGLFERLEARKAEIQEKNGWVWMHASSLGEFEQGRPILERIREERPEWGICLTFFSPSGFEARKGKGDADIVEYMPLDSRRNAERFVELLRPDLALFVKYELWYEHLKALRNAGVQSYLIAAVFRRDHRYFKWYGGFFRKMLGMFEAVHVQEAGSKESLERIGIRNVHISGDPRYDRVARIAEEADPIPMLERFKGDERLLVGGSSWPPEERLLEGFLADAPKGLKLLLAPHDVGERHIAAILERFGPHGVLRYSDDPSEEELREARVLVVDRIGLLARIYRYADLAMIGGGFGGALHNILEPLAHGVPVLFGPKVADFPEALEMGREGVAFRVEDQEALKGKVNNLFGDPEEWKRTMSRAKGVVEARTGATERILEQLLGGRGS